MTSHCCWDDHVIYFPPSPFNWRLCLIFHWETIRRWKSSFHRQIYRSSCFSTQSFIQLQPKNPSYPNSVTPHHYERIPSSPLISQHLYFFLSVCLLHYSSPSESFPAAFRQLPSTSYPVANLPSLFFTCLSDYTWWRQCLFN